MPPVLNENARYAKRFMLAALLIFCLASPLFCAEAEAQVPSPRFIVSALWEDGRDLALAPVTWDARDWGIFSTAVVPAFGILIKGDVALSAQWRVKQPWLEATMPGVTDLGDGLYSALGVAALWGGGELLGKDELAASSSTALESLGLCAVFSSALKYSVASVRPSFNDQSRKFFDYSYPGGSPSFPSGHSTVAFALAEVYGSSYGRWWTYPMAACVGYSRIYLDAHWPSDVLAGTLLGIAIGHFAVKGRHEQGIPGWRFSVAPGAAGGAMAMARLEY